jgi:hypothetical protein
MEDEKEWKLHKIIWKGFQAVRPRDVQQDKLVRKDHQFYLVSETDYSLRPLQPVLEKLKLEFEDLAHSYNKFSYGNAPAYVRRAVNMGRLDPGYYGMCFSSRKDWLGKNIDDYSEEAKWFSQNESQSITVQLGSNYEIPIVTWTTLAYGCLSPTRLSAQSAYLQSIAEHFGDFERHRVDSVVKRNTTGILALQHKNKELLNSPSQIQLIQSNLLSISLYKDLVAVIVAFL